MSIDEEKEAAARDSLRFVQSGCVVGLGSGSTASVAIRLLGERVHAGLQFRAVPTSGRSRDLAMRLGIPLATLDDCPEIDVTIDGADEIDPSLQLIKGGGGALLREKIIASASRQLIIVADSHKLVPVLGRFPLPVEVVPFAQALLTRRITSLGATVALRKDVSGNPFVTDEGHHILDCHFGEIIDAEKLSRELERMPGVVEHGLFLNMASVVLVAKGTKVVEYRPDHTSAH
jgi:ribose 5-phosphate isomerase A